jgi:hypothetical protein
MDTSLSAPNIIYAAEGAVEDPDDAPAFAGQFKARWGGLDDQSL